MILPDADAPGRKHAQKVAEALYDVAASIKVVDLYPERTDGHDVSDWLKHDGVGAKLFAAVKAAPEWAPADDKPIAAATPEDEALLVSWRDCRRSTTPSAASVQQPGSASPSANSMASSRDAARGEKKIDEMEMLHDHWQVVPWDEAVEGKILFRALSECVSRYVVMTGDQATAGDVVGGLLVAA